MQCLLILLRFFMNFYIHNWRSFIVSLPKVHKLGIWLMYTFWHTIRCNYKLWSVPWLSCVFLWLFTYIISNYSCLNCCIHTKLSQNVNLIVIHSLVCRYIRCDCKLWKVIWFKYASFRILEYYYIFETLLSSPIFHKLCVKAEV